MYVGEYEIERPAEVAGGITAHTTQHLSMAESHRFGNGGGRAHASWLKVFRRDQ